MSDSCQNRNNKPTAKEYFTSSAFIKTLLFVAGGILAGYLYYFYVGCSSGSCGITSNPYTSMLFGGAIGYFLNNSPCKSC